MTTKTAALSITLDDLGESEAFTSARYERPVFFRQREGVVHLAYADDGTPTSGNQYESFASLGDAEDFARRHGFSPIPRPGRPAVKRITKLNRQTLPEVRTLLEEHLKEFAQMTGLHVEIGNRIAFDPTHTNASIPLTVAVVDASGDAKTPERVALEQDGGLFGLPANSYGRTFSQGSRTYRLIGLNRRAVRMPLIAEDVATGKRYKFAADGVAALLKVQDGAP